MPRTKTFRPGRLDGLESRIAPSTVVAAMAEVARVVEHLKYNGDPTLVRDHGHHVHKDHTAKSLMSPASS